MNEVVVRVLFENETKFLSAAMIKDGRCTYIHYSHRREAKEFSLIQDQAALAAIGAKLATPDSFDQSAPVGFELIRVTY